MREDKSILISILSQDFQTLQNLLSSMQTEAVAYRDRDLLYVVNDLASSVINFAQHLDKLIEQQKSWDKEQSNIADFHRIQEQIKKDTGQDIRSVVNEDLAKGLREASDTFRYEDTRK